MSLNFGHKILQKAVKQYKYYETPDFNKGIEGVYNTYLFRTEGKKLKKSLTNLHGILKWGPEGTHIAAKNLLFQDNPDCWKYFERTALLWTYAHINDEFIDHIAPQLNYALYVEREDLLKILLRKAEEYLAREEYKTEEDYIKQPVYPSTYLIHFLIEKWGMDNPVKDKVMQYGKGLGIYQRIVDEWDNSFQEIEDDYWNSLCEYHLNGLSLTGATREKEEFIAYGLVPMELLNVFKVRKKLGLDVPEIKHELFQTTMAKSPVLPTGYEEGRDVRFQLVERTIKEQRRFTIEEIVEHLRNELGGEVELFY
ncbi:hypothetical protein EHV15_34950 [Paenibacillus oralis]|uniref:Uncharacterized protein n=1 Tax=Paenibacillus oralis TaxID=2490856 RepID=A0A3P3T9T0_9BACL|nr:hypothetical protein [Paenibacillus oralis]RRJ54791.1 hypothetical protein EHV15_34950 [Paenibacillus oralis]